MAREQANAASIGEPLLGGGAGNNNPSSSSSAFAAVGDSLRDASPPLQGLDRAVVVTGVSRGIGAAIARCLTAKGYHVFGTVRKAADAEELERSVGSRGSGRGESGSLFTPLVLDVCDADAVKKAAAKVASILGPRRVLAGLVNNAGVHVGSDPVALLSPETLRRQLEVNLVAPLVVTQAFLPLLGTDRSRDLGKPGRIFMMSSIYGCYGVPWNGAYSASKFGLEGLTECLRREIRLFGIGVTALRPGPISTDIWAEAEAEADSAGYWSKYTGVDGWGRAMELTRKYLTKEFAKRGWFWPAEKIGDAVVRILESHHSKGKFDVPAAAVLTPGYMDNWFLPMWLPAAVTDGFIAMKFGVAKVLPRIPFVGGGGGAGAGAGGEVEAKKAV